MVCVYIFGWVNILFVSHFLVLYMPVLYRLVHMPHTNVPHSFEYINRLLCHLGNFKFNLYADKLWKFTDFHCVFSVTRRLLMRSFLAQLQPLYHTSRESEREGAMQAQAVAINLSFVFFASLSLTFRKVIPYWNVLLLLVLWGWSEYFIHCLD